MISNTTTSYKLKASKSSRDFHNYNDNHIEENYGNDVDDSNRKPPVYSSRDGRYKNTRSRQTEFRPSKMGPAERRGYNRARGGSVSRRDRDFTDNSSYSQGRKYQEPLNRNTESAGMYYRSKCFEPEKKMEMKFNLPEDTRISKLLRRLSMEGDQENSLAISKKLLEVLLMPDNAHYVRKAFHILGDSLLDILRVAPGMAAKKQAARALGRMGYIMGQENDFIRFQDWMFNRMSSESDDIRYLFMKALKETLEFECKKCVLHDHAENLIHDLVAMIEVLENASLFNSTLDVLITLVEIYPEEFYSEFRDAVDILLGWHVDLTQPLSNIEFISKKLQRIKKHFQINLDFSTTLVHHFLEDIESCAKDLQVSEKNNFVFFKDSDSNSLNYMTVSILALNTVLKCLGDLLEPTNNELVTVKFTTDCLIQIVNTLASTLKHHIPDNLIIATNENISLLLGILGTKTSMLYNSIYLLIFLELSLVNKFSDTVIISMLLMISKVIKELSANLPLDLVQKLVGPQSQIIKLRYSHFKDVQEATISVYQALLNLKNIPLLQEAYRCVLGDLEIVYKQIVPNLPPLCQNNPFEDALPEQGLEKFRTLQEDPELAVLFLLRCLSQLANSSGSIIGLWALKPSILELFAVLLEPYNKELSLNTPSLQYSLLYLLYSHCKCYNHFIATSNLVCNKQDSGSMLALLGLPDGLMMNEVTAASPNSRNFALILDVVFNTLNTNNSCETTLLLLDWLNDILVHAEAYLVYFYNRLEFGKIAEVLVKCGYNYDARIVLSVSRNLKKLLHQKELSWNNSFLISINELCILHMNSNLQKIRDIYTNLSKNIPWDLTIIQFNKSYSIEEAKLHCADLNSLNNFTIVLAQHMHRSGSVYGEMVPFHFMVFMKYLLHGEERLGNWLEDIFTCCWPVEYDPHVNAINMEAFRSLAMHSRAVLNNWTTFEAAQLCVNSKLRTPLGKPNETFTSFEAVLKQLAKDVMKAKGDTDEVLCSSKVDQKRVRMFLQFMEHLEKSIYNAAEGCAIAMPPTSKPVRTFFHTNSSTCKEWLSRIRIVILHVALHTGQSTIALRHGHALLHNLILSNKGKTVDFERAVMYVTLALLNLRENEAIYGLYTWCKKVADRRFEWVKYAADQANKRYEIAAKNYKSVLDISRKKSESAEDSAEELHAKSSDVDIQTQSFISNQILNCYKELNSWNDVAQCQEESLASGHNENGIKYSFTTIDYDCVKALSSAEVLHSFNKLNTWKDQENNAYSWSIYDTLRKTESNLYNVALNINSPSTDFLLTKVNDSLNIIQRELQDNLLTLPSEFLQTFTLMHYVANGLKSVLNKSFVSNVFLVSENFENDIEKIDSTLLSKILWWSEYFSKENHNPGFNSFSNSLRLHIIRRARKEKNFNLALLHINKFFLQEEIFKNETSNLQWTIEEIGSQLIRKTVELSTFSVDIAKAVKESIKLLYATEENNKQLVFNLCASASKAISKNADMFCNQDMRQISSRILLKLATWLQSSEQNLISLTEISSPLVQLLMVLPEIGMLENVGANVIPINEMAVGKLLQFSVHQCIALAKNWYAFGTWCYRWGRKIVDHSSDIINSLSEEDKMAVQECLPMVTEDELVRILSILSLTQGCNEEDIDPNELNTSEIIQEELKKLPIVYGAHEDQLESLVQIWRKSQRRIYTYYELSADAYFKYLQLVTNSDNINKSTECNSITATLRLLRLIVKHAWELQNVLEEGLASTPTHPWKVIIPQLFSRLNHPEAYVRQRVSEFLCRVAEDAPHLITFPAVVGAVEGGVKFDFSEITMPKDCFSQGMENNEDQDVEVNEMEDAYESDSEESKHILQTCFKSMVETLSKQAPETISQVQLLVKELRRITLLWDELWLGTLAQYHSEIIQRQHQLEVEIEKVNENLNLDKDEKTSLISEKYRIIMKPIIFILEQLQSVTSIEPETPHEKQFQERYSDIINEVLIKLKNPDNADKPQESWQPLKLLQSKFQQKAHKRTAYSLKMQDISPILANMKDTVIAMPGVTTLLKARVTISSVSNHVSILPTKTKPKKLVFHGSDGQTYTYLFKGLEDLHLDERIMQFLSIANTMMAQGSNGSSHNLYRARHYSVIPLGPRSGLISWVDGTTPVFALYKRWQQREAAKANVKSGPGQRSNSNTNVGVLRPSELFYNKLNPLLQEYGVKNPENRKEWPLAVLKQVLTELMDDTPNYLLAKELWCHSINAGEWWRIVRNYSYSVAVMSTIGYIIGLGDRHLDNVLVDLTSGEVVHIDYNVCFEKGKTLRVPEKVPFRLTPNIQEALGVTGVEGIFRLACENVLKTMKKGRETLLTLLEAFVYDPLVDWTVGGEGLAGTAFRGVAGSSLTRQSRKDLEKEVTLSMYNVRCTEIKMDWISNRDNILEDIPHAVEKLEHWLKEDQKTSETEDVLQDLHQQMTLVKEAEANNIGAHSLYTLPTRYESYKTIQNVIGGAKTELESILHDTETHVQAYSEALNVLGSGQCSEWTMELNMSMDQESYRIFDLVKDFLQNAGQSNMVVQCEQSENDVEQLKQQQTLLTINCLRFLENYHNVYMQCPPSYRNKHRMFKYLIWCKRLLENNNVLSCRHVHDEFTEFLDTYNANSPVKSVIEFAYHLNVQFHETATLVANLFEDYSKTKESNKLVDTIYASANLALTSFLRCEKDALNALKYVTLIELSKLNKDYLNSEDSVLKIGNVIVKQGGDWFLDDLTWHSNNVMEFISYPLLQQNNIEDVMFLQAVNGMQAVNRVYKSLQELYLNFHSIILPESMKKILHEEPSVELTINEFNNLVLHVGTPISELIACLEKHRTCIVMEMEVSPSHSVVMEKISQIKAKYQMMVTKQSDDLTHGNMLLMGFNGLFDKVNTELQNLISTMSVFEIPLSWRKVDQVRQARSLSAPIYNSQVKAVFDDIFLLKRIQTMQDYFNLAMEMCNSFKDPKNGATVYNDEQLDKPIKKFITEFVTRQFLGIPTETVAYTVCILLQNLGLNVTSEIEQKDIGAEHKVSLDDLIKKAGNLFLKRGIFTQNILAQASSLQTNLKTSWNILQAVKLKEQRLHIMRITLERLENQVTGYGWLHENGVSSNSPMGMNTAIVRSRFLHDLRNETTNLKNLLTKIIEARDQQKTLVTSVSSRLNWAAGVNPDFNQVLSAFENSVSMRETHLDLEQQIASLVHKTCYSILQHELLRSQTPEAGACDTRFFNSLAKWQKSCQLNGSKQAQVTPTEENIMKLYTPDLATDSNWVTKLSEKLSKVITLTQKQLSDEKENLFVVGDTVHLCMEKLKGDFTTQSKLVAEVKSLLKSMTKIEEYSRNAQEFMMNYRIYTDAFSPISHCFKKEMNRQEAEEIVKNLLYLAEHTETVYDSLINLEVRSDVKGNNRPPLVRQDGISQSPLKIMLPVKQESTSKGQQRNGYAMGVWRRVRLKLEGRDPDPGRKYSNQEQVDYIIREASSLDNLALMYEGWTPWV